MEDHSTTERLWTCSLLPICVVHTGGNGAFAEGVDGDIRSTGVATIAARAFVEAGWKTCRSDDGRIQMLNSHSAILGLVMALTGVAGADRLWADETLPPPPTLPGATPLQAPPAVGSVPVPDVHGRSEADARRALAESGLSLGVVEHVAIARLTQAYGQQYAPGIVVQQAPPPSATGQASWLPRGTAVSLRISALNSAAPVATSPRPAIPTRPGMPSGPPGAVRFGPSPASPSALRVQPSEAAPMPRAPVGPAPAALADIRACISLPCERCCGTWQVRPVGGWAFTAGSDSGDAGLYAGVDIGYTLSGCFGLDLYYRYSGQTFDLEVPGGVLEDSGGFHHVGLKATYQGAFSRSGRFTWWTGLGLGGVRGYRLPRKPERP